jgi:tetratricopeptide (TPR) repeat protein
MLAGAMLASVYSELGRYDESLALATQVAGKAPGSHCLAGVALARAGRTGEARAELDRLVELAKRQYVPAYDIASVHAALGDAEQAFLWLDKALAEPSALLPTIRVIGHGSVTRRSRYHDLESGCICRLAESSGFTRSTPAGSIHPPRAGRTQH